MISLLEKEARDPVEVLRVKLKDSTETSLLNSQLLQEIKHDYLLKQDSTKGQLDAFVQAHVDEIERASALLEFEDTVAKIVENFNTLGVNCKKMREELGEKRLTSGISVARRNLKELENQIAFYEELPSKLQALHRTLDTRIGDIVPVSTKWQPLDDWRQRILQELKNCLSDPRDDLGNSRAQNRILESMLPRLDSIENVYNRILNEVWGCMHHCVEIAQFNKKRLQDCFHVLEMMEKRRKRYAENNRDYLNNQMNPVTNINTTYYDRCKDEISSYLRKRVDEMFRFSEKEAEEQKDVLDTILGAANNLLMDLEIVQSDVVSCFPNEIEIMQVFTSSYTASLETEISKLSLKPDMGIAQKLQLVQWIEYYNSEIIKYKRARASAVLEQISQMMMSQYIDQIKGQINMWVSNIWKREEEHVVGPNGELQSTRPNDIINILKSQISIGQEWLTGILLGRVVVSCLDTLMDQLKTRHVMFSSKLAETDIEMICSFINDTDVLQAKCPGLVEEISFAETTAEEKAAFDTFMGDALDSTSVDIVKLAVGSSELIVDKIFAEVETDTLKLWLSKKWDEGDAVVENLLATLDDYYGDLRRWISGSFFFSKLVRQCLDRTIKEYCKRLTQRTHAFVNPEKAASLVEKDMNNLVDFFSKFINDLRRTGIRSVDDIKKEYCVLFVIAEILKGHSVEVTDDPQHRDAIAQVRRLLPNHMENNGSEKTSKSLLKKNKKTNEISSKDKPKDKKSTQLQQNSEPRAVDEQNQGDFEVHKLDFNDFLGK